MNSKGKHQGIHLQRLGMKRRKKEVRHMKIMAALTVFFLALTLLFQDNMSNYQMEMNYRDYGAWFMREPEVSALGSNPYLEDCGQIWSGSMIYRQSFLEAKETIEIDPLDEKGYTEKLIGYLEPDIIQKGNICLYEGKFPEKENEIAMDLSVLQELGCDYELGQEISFYLAENEDITDLIRNNQKMKLNRVTYTLVGTIKSYTTLWNEGDVLPNAVITKEAFEQLTMPKKAYNFLSIKEEYLDEDAVLNIQFAEELWNKNILKKLADNGIKWKEEGYIFNQFAYGNAFWGNRVMYRNMTILLIVLSSSVMAYLMSSYLSKRRKYYYQLREIGATVSQIWRMAIYECVWGTLPMAMLSLVLSYIVSILVVFGVARGAGIPFFYTFLWKTLLTIILCVVLILCLSMLAALIIFRSKRITDSRAAVPKRARKRLKRHSAKQKKQIGLNDVWKREYICHPLSTIFSRIVGILACAAVLACITQIHEKVLSYERTCQEFVDYSVSALGKGRSFPYTKVPVIPYIDHITGEKVTTEGVGFSEDSTFSMKNLISDSVIQNIRELSGVKQVDGITTDVFHIFSWEGKEESQFRKRKLGNLELKGVLDTSTELGRKYKEEKERTLYETRCFQNCKSVWEEMKPHLDKETADYDAFCRGEQAILLESDVEIDWEDSAAFKYEPMDSTLKPGDILSIQTTGKDVNVVVASVMSADEMEYFGSPYILLGSEALGRKIAAEDRRKFGYNKLEIHFNALSDSEATGKIIARQCARNHLNYDSGFEEIQTAFRRVTQAILVYGTLAVIIFVLYVFVLSCILQEENRKWQRKRQALHGLGVSQEQLQKAKIRKGRREALYLLISVPIVYMLWAFRENAEWSENIIAYTSIFFHKTIYEMTQWKWILYNLADVVNIIWLLIFMFVACGTVFLLHMKKGKEA